MRFLLIAIAVLLIAAGTAHAQGALDRAADTLKLDPVYVDPDAQQAISDDEAEDLRAQIAEENADPLYIAVLPEDAAGETGPFSALEEIVRSVGQDGVYAAIIGDSFRAGATDTNQLPPGRAGELARAALEEHRPDGSAAVLEDFVRRVARARGQQEAGSGSDDGNGFPWVLVALGGGALALFGVSRRRKVRQANAEFADAKSAARDEVIALGEEIRELDLDVEMPGADADAKRHYGLAVERYQEAEQALDGARRPDDLRAVSEGLEEGRWAMLAARAKLAGQDAPERRAPCFFDPRHGPSVTDVEWAPARGEPRPVPVCAADAVRVQKGEDPESREVSINGRSMPYWQAGPAYGPFAGGFFAGGLVPGLFLGSMLGGGFGMFGEAQASDMGDFGGGFGGGDFGGGDFGGGGGDF